MNVSCCLCVQRSTHYRTGNVQQTSKRRTFSFIWYNDVLRLSAKFTGTFRRSEQMRQQFMQLFSTRRVLSIQYAQAYDKQYNSLPMRVWRFYFVDLVYILEAASRRTANLKRRVRVYEATLPWTVYSGPYSPHDSGSAAGRGWSAARRARWPRGLVAGPAQRAPGPLRAPGWLHAVPRGALDRAPGSTRSRDPRQRSREHTKSLIIFGVAFDQVTWRNIFCSYNRFSLLMLVKL